MTTPLIAIGIMASALLLAFLLSPRAIKGACCRGIAFADSLEWLQSQLRLTGRMFLDHYRHRTEELRAQHHVGNMPSGLEREA